MRPIQAKTIWVKCAYLRRFSSFKAFHPARLGKIVCEIFFWCIGVNGIKCCTTLWNVFSQRHFHCVGRLEKVHSRFLLFSSISSFLKLLPTSSWIAFPPFSSHFLICNPCALSQLICRVTIFQKKIWESLESSSVVSRNLFFCFLLEKETEVRLKSIKKTACTEKKLLFIQTFQKYEGYNYRIYYI